MLSGRSLYTYAEHGTVLTGESPVIETRRLIMEFKSFAKINLSLDVLGRREDGYHNISSLMQDVGLYDVIKIERCLQSGTKYNFVHCTILKVDVYLCMNVETIPMDDRNLVIKGARAIIEALDESSFLN